MSDRVAVAAWSRVYVDSRNQVAEMLTRIRRRNERAKACLKVLLDASTALTSRAPAAISAPSADHAIALAEIAGAAWAARDVIQDGQARRGISPDSTFLVWLAQRSAAWGGTFAPALMAASDGEMGMLLGEGAAPKLETALEAGRVADPDWLVQPGFTIDHAAAFLAELNAAARPRPAAVHQARAEALDQEIASTGPDRSAVISAHAFAVHELTGVYGPGVDAVRSTMLRLVATHPPEECATLQASKVAALLSDALSRRARMVLLDAIIVALGPGDSDPSVRTRLARDSALVLLLLDAGAVAPGDQTDVEMPIAVERSTGPSAHARGTDAIAEILAEAESAMVATVAERQTGYQRAVDAGSIADALAIVRDAAAEDDHEQAWSLLQDIALRHPEADSGDLVTVAPDVMGPVALDSDGVFDGPGAGCFTVLSPAPAEAAAAMARIGPRLLNVDDRGIEHPDSGTAQTSGAYTPNYLHDIDWCDRGTRVMLDTKGAMSAPMGRTMVGIITRALIDDRVPALVTGWIPALDAQMTRWESGD